MCEEKLFETCKQLQETKQTIEVEKAAVATAEEKIQKLERRLIFVTKARKLMGTGKLMGTASFDREPGYKRDARLVLYSPHPCTHPQEREGCINVLSSYKRDSGVDGVMRELLAEVSTLVIVQPGG